MLGMSGAIPVLPTCAFIVWAEISLPLWHELRVYIYAFERGVYRVLVGGGNLMERDHLGDPVVDGRIILRWIFRK